MDKSVKKSWIVTLDCSVTKEIITESCTEEQAKSNPFLYAANEQDLMRSNIIIESVKEVG